MFTKMQWPWLPSSHTHGITGLLRLEKTLCKLLAQHRVLPPGQGGWQQLLLRAGTYSHCPQEGSCCQELKVASHSLLTVSIFAASNYSLFQSSTLEKAPCSQGRGNPTVTASSNTSSFLLESFWSSPASNGPRPAV